MTRRSCWLTLGLAIGLWARGAVAEPWEAASAVATLAVEVELPARVAGVVAERPIREGQRVQRGDVLLRVDATAARIALRRAEQELELARLRADDDVAVRFARKSVEVAAAEWARAQESVAQYERSVSTTELDRLRLALEQVQLEVERAEHEQQAAVAARARAETDVAAAQARLDEHAVVAPFDGVAVEATRRPGEWVEPGQPVVRIVDVDTLRVEAFVPGERALECAAGQQVRFEVRTPDGVATAFPATLDFVSPEIDPVTGQARIWAAVENRDGRLRPGSRGVLVFAP